MLLVVFSDLPGWAKPGRSFLSVAILRQGIEGSLKTQSGFKTLTAFALDNRLPPVATPVAMEIERSAG